MTTVARTGIARGSLARRPWLRRRIRWLAVVGTGRWWGRGLGGVFGCWLLEGLSVKLCEISGRLTRHLVVVLVYQIDMFVRV